MFFSVSNRELTGVETLSPPDPDTIFFDTNKQNDISVWLMSAYGRAPETFPLTIGQPDSDEIHDNDHGTLFDVTENRVAWFYTGLGKNETRRDTEAIATLMKTSDIEFTLPVEDRPYTIRISISMDDFERTWRDNLGPLCDWVG